MAGVGLTGKIVPLNGGNFPVWEDINGQGGWRTVPTIAARNALVTAGPQFLKRGMVAFVESTQCAYLLNVDLATWSFLLPSPALQLQAAWEINQATGSDDNTGLPGSPLATTEELCRRLCPRGQVWTLAQNTTITISPGNYGAIDLTYTHAEPLLNLTMRIVGVLASSTPDLITSIVDTTPATQGRITLQSGAALTARSRIRVTAGPSIGAITYGVGPLNAPNDTFIKTWFPNTAAALNNVVVTNDTPVAIDVLGVTVQRCTLRPLTRASGVITEVRDLILPGNATMINPQNNTNAAAFGCRISGGRGAGNYRLINCQFTGTVLYVGQVGAGTPTIAGCCFSQALFFTDIAVAVNTACCFDASQVQIGGNGLFGAAGTATLQEWSNGAGLTAIALGGSNVSALFRAGFCWAAGQIIGFGTPYEVGYNLESGCCALVLNPANIEIPSVTNVIMSGQARTYAQLANGGDFQRANCFWSRFQDTTAAFNDL